MQKNIPTMMESLSQLIAAPSVSSVDPCLDQSNRGVVDLLANWFEELGFKVELMPVSGTASGDPAIEKFNLIACMGEGEEGLVLSGHTDTVPCNANQWHSEPLTLTEKQGRLYGLGVCDMKSFFPIVMEVVQHLHQGDLQRPLTVLATADEESNMSGAKALAASGESLGRYALIGEPTGLQPIYMHKGILIESIRLQGQAGHASDPSLGNSALEGMHRVMGVLLAWRQALQKRFQDPRFSVPMPTLNLGVIHGGDNPNRICAKCELTVDLRLMPDMVLEAIRLEMRALISEALVDSGLDVEYDLIFDGLPSFATDINSEIVQTAEKLCGCSSGTVAFGTEGPYLNAMNMDTVILGPGDIAQAHQANEYLSLDRLSPMVDILTSMVRHFCTELD